jgi:hypothetical protein
MLKLDREIHWQLRCSQNWGGKAIGYAWTVFNLLSTLDRWPFCIALSSNCEVLIMTSNRHQVKQQRRTKDASIIFAPLAALSSRLYFHQLTSFKPTRTCALPIRRPASDLAHDASPLGRASWVQGAGYGERCRA